MKSVLVAALLLCVSSPGFAADTPEDFAADVREMLRITGSSDIPRQMGSAILSQLSQSLRSAQPNAPDRAFEILREVTDEKMLVLDQKGGLIDQMVAAYQQAFSHAEVRELLEFYRTPLGAKVVETTPQLVAQAMSLGQQTAQQLVPVIQEEFGVRVESEGITFEP